MRTNDFEQISPTSHERSKRLNSTIAKINMERLDTNRDFSR